MPRVQRCFHSFHDWWGKRPWLRCKARTGNEKSGADLPHSLFALETLLPQGCQIEPWLFRRLCSSIIGLLMVRKQRMYPTDQSFASGCRHLKFSSGDSNPTTTFCISAGCLPKRIVIYWSRRTKRLIREQNSCWLAVPVIRIYTSTNYASIRASR